MHTHIHLPQSQRINTMPIHAIHITTAHIRYIFSISFCITSCSSVQPPSHPIPQTASPSSLVTSIYHSAALQCARMNEESNTGHPLQTASLSAENSVPFAVTMRDNSPWIVLPETVSPPHSWQSAWSVVFPLCI